MSEYVYPHANVHMEARACAFVHACMHEQVRVFMCVRACLGVWAGICLPMETCACAFGHVCVHACSQSRGKAALFSPPRQPHAHPCSPFGQLISAPRGWRGSWAGTGVVPAGPELGVPGAPLRRSPPRGFLGAPGCNGASLERGRGRCPAQPATCPSASRPLPPAPRLVPAPGTGWSC